jgi:hypothetical protein
MKPEILTDPHHPSVLTVEAAVPLKYLVIFIKIYGLESQRNRIGILNIFDILKSTFSTTI